MKFIITSLFLAFSVLTISSQTPYGTAYIQDMKWDSASNIHLTLFNGLKYTAKIEDILHARSMTKDSTVNEFIYYPVMLASDFVDKINEFQTKEKEFPVIDTSTVPKPITLWGTIHGNIGGGWVHFINCLVYTLETRNLVLTSTIMERPISDWKPSPKTDTWKRTKDWDYYVPVDQRDAQKEYELRKKENQLSNLQDVPPAFINLFLETNNGEYKKLVKNRKYKELAKIDLVKLLIGANYLGKAQINYVKNAVQTALLKYSYNQFPSIIIFDDLGAAVVLSLNEKGYKLEKLIFQNPNISAEERETNELKIEITIATINKVNKNIFENRLRKMYH